MTKQKDPVLRIFEQCGAILKGHFVYTSGRHGEVDVNKHAIYPFQHIHRLCDGLAEKLKKQSPMDALIDIDAVVAPAFWGIVLSRLMADRITDFNWNDGLSTLAIYAEKNGDKFVIRRGYDKLIAGKNVWIVDDIMTTGGSVKKVVEAAADCGAKVCGAAVLWNRGGVTADMLGVPHLFSLVEKQLDSWNEADCPLCKSGAPINQEVGKGREFLTRKAIEDVARVANMAVKKVFERKTSLGGVKIPFSPKKPRFKK